MSIFSPNPATGGVLAACGLCDLRGLLFKILFPFGDASIWRGIYLSVGIEGLLRDSLKFVVRPFGELAVFSPFFLAFYQIYDAES